MCGLIGVHLIDVTAQELKLVADVIIESRIRGKHATGVSYVRNNKLHTIKESLPADEFLKKHNIADFVDIDNQLHLIAHCRYSTSNLLYNQPIANDVISIVHNGVVTQELPENWQKMYGYVCETANDTELLLHTIMNDDCVLTKWYTSSLAVIELHVNKDIWCYRNGKRPLYLNLHSKGFIITSTADIAFRAGITTMPWLLESNVYTMLENGRVKYSNVTINALDMQEQSYDI